MAFHINANEIFERNGKAFESSDLQSRENMVFHILKPRLIQDLTK